MYCVFIFRLSPGCVLPVPGASVVVWFGRFPVVVLWCCVCVLAFGGCWLCLPLLFCAFFLCCLGLLRIGSFPPGSVPPLVLPAPSVGPLGLSGPVSFLLVPPSGYLLYLATARLSCLVVWSVVTARLLSSLFLMATKASALCGALPSTPCCGCCSGAFLSCTEVFALG